MKLIINEFGSYLSKKENRFVIKTKEKKEEYSADKIDQIIISSPSSITEGVVKLATEKNIDIVFTSYNGKPFARIYPCTLGGTTLTRREQAKAYFDERGKVIVKKVLEAKIENQLVMLKKLNKTRRGIFDKEIQILEEHLKKFISFEIIDIDSSRDKLLGFEGYAASLYFSCLNQIKYFGKRDPKSQDIFNITLNYGYGILYSEVERACILAGLDPYLGFLHTDRYGKPSMTLDLIEQFRPLIDKSVINLFVQKKMLEGDLEQIGEGTILTKEGRTKIINEVMKALSKRVQFGKKHFVLSQAILEQARSLVRFLLGESEKFQTFIWR